MMYFTMQIKEAISNLLTAKLRAFLAIFGILVGTGSVVAMVSSGQMATAQALSQFKQLGTDLLSVSLFQDLKNSSEGTANTYLTMQNVKNIALFEPSIKNISGYTMLYVPAAYEGRNLDVAVIGADSQLTSVIKIMIAKGRALSFMDEQSMFCVVGSDVAKKLKLFGILNPIGKQIRLGNNYFTIIGVANKWQENDFFNQNINHSIIVPLNTSLMISKNAKVANIVMRLKGDINIDSVEARIKQYIAKILPGQRYYFRSAKQLVASMAEQQKALTIMLGLIGSISLFVGGIGVMNIMLVSVIERKQEIGIRKAVGAKQKDIRWLFLIESMILTLVGGILGIIAGITTSLIIAKFAHWKFHVFILPCLIGFVVSVAVGIFFGFYPAYQASRLDPIQALRVE